VFCYFSYVTEGKHTWAGAEVLLRKQEKVLPSTLKTEVRSVAGGITRISEVQTAVQKKEKWYLEMTPL
jgi:hypothetical protein